MDIITWLVVGLVAGALASFVVGGVGYGLVGDLFVSPQACGIGKLALPNHIRVIRILGLTRTVATRQHATARHAVFFQHIAS